MRVLDWLGQSPVGTWVAESIWGYPIVLSLHAVGMGLVVGGIAMSAIVVWDNAGAETTPLLRKLRTIVWSGITLNLCSGLTLFAGDPGHFYFHPVFRAKILLVLVGIAGFAKFSRAVERKGPPPSGSSVRFLAGVMLLAWLSALVAGRSIAYFDLE